MLDRIIHSGRREMRKTIEVLPFNIMVATTNQPANHEVKTIVDLLDYGGGGRTANLQHVVMLWPKWQNNKAIYPRHGAVATQLVYFHWSKTSMNW
jgi:hypothetical protein